MTRLFVIEAPGKARTMEAMLEKIDFVARVQATKGHFFQMPDKLDPIGIDRAYREFERKPRDLQLIERIRREALAAEEVFVATDADQEGDVIAWDVADLIRDIHPAPKRVRLKGMDAESVKEAIAEAAPVRKADALAGRTRAIVDRLIGAGFSRGGVAVGRVGTALLGLVQQQKPSTVKLRLVAPASDGGRPWSAETDLMPPLDEDIARQLAALSFPALEISSVRKATTHTDHMGDIMVKVGDKLDLPPHETAGSMQRLYEAGRMSYPRAGSRGISAAVSAKMAEVLRKAGYKVDDEAFPIKDETDVHDSPYPMGPVDLTGDPEKMGQDESVRAMVARNMVKSGQTQTEQSAFSMVLTPFLRNKGFSDPVAEFVAAMPWRREIGPRYPGQESWPKSQMTYRRADVVLLERAVAAGLGRPSTWANHVQTFMSRGLVDENLALTAKGQDWINGSPKELLDPRVSAAIERACERAPAEMMSNPDREPWEMNAERIVKALPPPLRLVVEKLVANEAPRPKIDPIEAYGLTENFVEAAEEAAAAATSPGYVPKHLLG